MLHIRNCDKEWTSSDIGGMKNSRKNTNITLSIKMKLYDSLVLSAILYSEELWPLQNKQLDEHQKFHRVKLQSNLLFTTLLLQVFTSLAFLLLYVSKFAVGIFTITNFQGLRLTYTGQRVTASRAHPQPMLTPPHIKNLVWAYTVLGTLCYRWQNNITVTVPLSTVADQGSSSSKCTSPPRPSPGGNACANT